jgi:enamine deaminase RidA (YjgF/YER057c/UK114 family)
MARKPIRPWHGEATPDGVRVAGGTLVCTSGMGAPRAGESVPTLPAGAGVQARSALERIAVVVETAGGSVRDIVKVTCYLVRMEDLAAVEAALRDFFGTDAPCCTTVQVAGLAWPGLVVELDAWAVVAPRPAARKRHAPRTPRVTGRKGATRTRATRVRATPPRTTLRVSHPKKKPRRKG